MKYYATTCISCFICLLFTLLAHSLSLSENSSSSDKLRARALDSPLLPRGDQREKRKKSESGSPTRPERRVSARLQGLPPSDTVNPTRSQSQTPSTVSDNGSARQTQRQSSPQVQSPARVRSQSPVQGLVRGGSLDRRIQPAPHNQLAAARQIGYLSAAAGVQLARQQAGLLPANTQNVRACHEAWSITCHPAYARAAIHSSGRSVNFQHSRSMQSNIRPPAINIARHGAGSGITPGSSIFRWPNMPSTNWEIPAWGSRQQMIQQIRNPPQQHDNSLRPHPFQGMYQGATLGLQQAENQTPTPNTASRMIPNPGYPLTQQQFMQGHNQGRGSLINERSQQHNLFGGGSREQTFHHTSRLDFNQPRESYPRGGAGGGANSNQVWGGEIASHLPVNQFRRQAYGLGEGGTFNFGLRPQPQLLGGGGALHIVDQAHNQGGIPLTPEQIARHAALTNRPAQSYLPTGLGGTGQPNPMQVQRQASDPWLSSFGTNTVQNQPLGRMSEYLQGGLTAHAIALNRPNATRRQSSQGENLATEPNQPSGGVGDALQGGQTALAIARNQRAPKKGSKKNAKPN